MSTLSLPNGHYLGQIGEKESLRLKVLYIDSTAKLKHVLWLRDAISTSSTIDWGLAACLREKRQNTEINVQTSKVIGLKQKSKSDREKMIISISPWNSFRLSISEYYGPRPAVSTFVNLYITNKVNFSFEIYCYKYLKKVAVFSNQILRCLLLGIGQVEFSSLGFGFGFFFHIAQIRFTITGLLIFLRKLRI